ncbi:hypothetical protein TRIUR3_20786 [Triticum urartu]|uniref:Uncharacterized protein n=1 Tax=Triticum urartu TaxID=4572 RepID=M7Z4L7_TRIUA|nr:hypothetical protein TRIUR3_20786 [Triticum urartu]
MEAMQVGREASLGKGRAGVEEAGGFTGRRGGVRTQQGDRAQGEDGGHGAQARRKEMVREPCPGHARYVEGKGEGRKGLTSGPVHAKVICRRPELPFRGLAIFSSPADVIAFEDEDDGGGCALPVGGFHHYLQVGTGARASTSVCPRSSELRQAGAHPPLHPDAGCVDLIPLPQEIEGPLDWDTGEMEGNFSADQRAKVVVVLYMVPGDLNGQFHAEKMGYHEMVLLRPPRGVVEESDDLSSQQPGA